MNMSFKQVLLTNWHFRRWLALFAGIFFAFQAINESDTFSWVISFVLLFQAVTNTGCFGGKTCGVPLPEDTRQTEPSDITYTTIK